MFNDFKFQETHKFYRIIKCTFYSFYYLIILFYITENKAKENKIIFHPFPTIKPCRL